MLSLSDQPPVDCYRSKLWIVLARILQIKIVVVAKSDICDCDVRNDS